MCFAVAVCHVFPSYHNSPCSLVALSSTNIFSLSCLHLRENTRYVTIDQFGPQNSVLALPS
jgi:hypothetical protein